jgi:ribonuclease HI
MQLASNALQTDALACLEALRAASDLVVTDIEVESDALVLVQAEGRQI